MSHFRSIILILVTLSLWTLSHAGGKEVDICKELAVKLEDIHKKYSFPGAVVAAILKDGTECNMAVGKADVEKGIDMQKTDRMLAASIGKTFVAAAVIDLNFKGKLAIDDPISKWLVDEPLYAGLAHGDRITIRHLLSHTSGLTDHVYSKNYGAAMMKVMGTDAIIPPEDLVGFIAGAPARFLPGAGYAYTDTGYILLGLIIEKVSGQSFYSYVADNFLTPLHLDMTSPSNKRELSGLVQGYISVDNFRKIPETVKFDPITTTLDNGGKFRWNPGTEWTGGGFISNALDLARWVKLHFSGRSMPHEYLELVLTGSPYIAKNGVSQYGLGVSLYDVPGGEIRGHTGWTPGYRSAAFYFPEQDLSYAIQINTDINLQGEVNNFLAINLALQEALFGNSQKAGE